MSTGASSFHVVMAGHSRSKNGVASARLRPAIHDLLWGQNDVEARDEPGHDEADRIA
jgi:hypothetical protein